MVVAKWMWIRYLCVCVVWSSRSEVKLCLILVISRSEFCLLYLLWMSRMMDGVRVCVCVLFLSAHSVCQTHSSWRRNNVIIANSVNRCNAVRSHVRDINAGSDWNTFGFSLVRFFALLRHIATHFPSTPFLQHHLGSYILFIHSLQPLI